MTHAASPRQLRAAEQDRRLWLAIAASVLFHGLLLMLHFTFPDASQVMRERALDIILVNAKSARKPHDAQALAQANLDGGGNVDDNRRAKTPCRQPSARPKATMCSRCSAGCRNSSRPSRNC